MARVSFAGILQQATPHAGRCAQRPRIDCGRALTSVGIDCRGHAKGMREMAAVVRESVAWTLTHKTVSLADPIDTQYGVSSVSPRGWILQNRLPLSVYELEAQCWVKWATVLWQRSLEILFKGAPFMCKSQSLYELAHLRVMVTILLTAVFVWGQKRPTVLTVFKFFFLFMSWIVKMPRVEWAGTMPGTFIMPLVTARGLCFNENVIKFDLLTYSETVSDIVVAYERGLNEVRYPYNIHIIVIFTFRPKRTF